MKNNKETDSLKGTLASVMMLGVFMLITWAAVYYLFLIR